MTDEQTTAQTSPQEPFLQAMERARQLNEQIMDGARKAGDEMLQRYVGWLEGVADQQQKLASAPQVTQIDWLAAMLNAQADFTREFAKSLRQLPSGAPR